MEELYFYHDLVEKQNLPLKADGTFLKQCFAVHVHHW